jgi:hypothetical protein
MSLQIRITQGKKKPQQNSHRDFTDFEKILNKLTTSQAFVEHFMPKVDPYELKALPDKLFIDRAR